MPSPSATKGRKSPLQQASERIRKAEKHPPPETLSERGQEIWIEIVEPLPKDHFFHSDLPILREYCEILADIELARSKWDGSMTVVKNNGDEVTHPVINTIGKWRTQAAAYASKLRVCPSSRLSASKAGHERQKPKSKREGLMK